MRQTLYHGPYRHTGEIPDRFRGLWESEFLNHREPPTPFLIIERTGDLNGRKSYDVISDRRRSGERRAERGWRRQVDRDTQATEDAMVREIVDEREQRARAREWTMLVIGLTLGMIGTAFLCYAM